MARLNAGLIGGAWMFAAMAGAMAPVAGAATVTTLNPTQDTYVSSANSTANYGSATTFAINSANGSTNHRWAYMQFDLSGVTDLANLTSIELDLTNPGNTLHADSRPVAIYGLLDAADTWSESTLTYANDPNNTSPGDSNGAFNTAQAYGGTPLATFDGTKAAGINVAFDAGNDSTVLNYIAADADKIVTFVIVSQYTGSYGDGLAFRSADSDNVPVLKLTTTAVAVPEPASMGLLAVAGAGLLARRRGR